MTVLGLCVRTLNTALGTAALAGSLILTTPNGACAQNGVHATLESELAVTRSAWWSEATPATDFFDPAPSVFDPAETLRVVRGQDSVYDEPLVTDRPDFTEASSVVGRGVLQLETGYTFFYNDDETDGSLTRTHGGPELLLRYGVTEAIELRLIWNYLWERSIDAMGVADDTAGSEDFIVGTKIQLTSECGYRPESAIIFQLGTPTGHDSFSNGRVTFGVNFLYSWSLPHDWSLAGSTGYSTGVTPFDVGAPGLPILTDDNHNVYHQSVALGVPITEALGFYIEYFGLYSEGLAQDFPQHFIDGGFAYLLTDNQQIDIRAGVGLNDMSDDFFGGMGYSVRF